MKSQKHHVNTPEALTQLLQTIATLPTNGAYEIEIKKLPKTRTSQQNKALHKYLTNLASALNEAGYSVQVVLQQGVDREWDMETAKSQLWKPVQKALTNVSSTAEAERNQYTQVYEVLNRFMGEKFGVHVPFPSREFVQ